MSSLRSSSSRDVAAVGRYWAKTGSGESGPGFHPLVYHGLDVAAAGAALCSKRPRLLDTISKVAGIAPNRLQPWLTFLLAVHDLGKIADGFQAKAPDLMRQLQGRFVDPGDPERHDALGFRLWRQCLRSDSTKADGRLPRTGERECWQDLLEPWLGAVMGHHGRPVRLATPGPDLSKQFPPEVVSDAEAMWQELATLLMPDGLPFDLEPFDEQESQFRQVSWLVAGFVNLADWIGSNTEWFPFAEAERTAAEYWQDVAQPRAGEALARSGLSAPLVRPAAGVRGLFPEAGFASLTPLQQLAEQIPLAPGPQLFVIEEVTGGGKTEAALTLAHRLMAAGRAGEIFIGLPTMATANAMHGRVEPVFRRLFDEGCAPSLVLAHSKRHLRQPLADTPRDRPYDRGEPTASLDCAAWLADSRKKALLAQVGVGTLDQVLMAILPLRHQGLRLAGLVGKILIVDEVHACDAYVERLLSTLLTFHAAFGGSAILLSASLSQKARRELSAAFARGLGVERPALDSEASYPLLTQIAAGPGLEVSFEAREALRREVGVVLLRSSEEVEAHLLASLDSGGCACWIRNTVDDALEAYDFWRERLGEDRVHLLHARFTVADRRRIEQDIQARFGKSSTAGERRGHLLIATQVVEQSLDLDFDCLVSDLAPIDRLIQRVGRQKRHARDREGNPIAGPDQRGSAVLGVYGPEPIEAPEGSWYEGFFPRGAWVYPHHGQLWLTARWLAEHGRFRMPEDARAMVEGVFGESAVVPAGLEARSVKAEGESRGFESIAATNALKLDLGYKASTTEWLDDVTTPTRLGEPTTVVRLVRQTAGGFKPWHADLDHPWEQSEVTVRRARIAAEDPTLPADLVARLKAEMPDEGRGVVVLVMEETLEGAKSRGLNPSGGLVALHYEGLSGLAVEK